jgi:L-glyceraldehyde 3-phosphate reductase
MLNRWIEEPYSGDDPHAARHGGAGFGSDSAKHESLIDVLADEQMGCIVFSPLAQGLLTDKYLEGVPAGSRATKSPSWNESMLTDENLTRVRALNSLAAKRGQTLAQMAVAWVLRQPTVTSALVGASSVAQLDDTVGALDALEFDDATLALIDRYALDSDINIWSSSFL